MSEKVERRAENGAGGGAGGAVDGGLDGTGGVVDINCHDAGAFSVPLISKVSNALSLILKYINFPLVQ